MSSVLKAADLFCGGGGTSQGAEQSGAARVVCAVNHWARAIDTHSANFPHAKHINSRLDQVNPGESPKMDLLFASPECTHFSVARGGRPTSDQQRSGAWDVMRWLEFHRPSYLVVENVAEFKSWGPVNTDTGRPLKRFKGKFFDAWLMAIQAAGYRVDHRLLNAADFGAATSRTRLFVVARKGNRNPVWPEPTHAARVGGELPGLGLKRWRSAAEIIDWQIPCKSVFLRKQPLKDKTLLRIEAGLRRFVEPFVVTLRNNAKFAPHGDPLGTITSGGRHHGVAVPFAYQLIGRGAGRSREVDSPLPTIVAARENQGVAVPFISRVAHGDNGRWGNSAHSLDQTLPTLAASKDFALTLPILSVITHGGRNLDLSKPMPTITTANRGEHAITVPFLTAFHNGNDSNRRNYPLSQTLPTLDTSNRYAVTVPFITTYYANGKAYPLTEPLCTLSTRDRCGLAMAVIETAGDIEPRSEGERRLLATMRELGVADVGFRMLTNPELAAAQGFPSSYIFRGNKGEVTRQIGNAVVPNVAEAITRELAGAA